MKNSDFDYSYQYLNWHNDTVESKINDVNFSKSIFATHAIYPNSHSARILEVGCGMGRLLLMLREQGYQNLTGVDIDRSQIEIAKKENLNVCLADAIDFLTAHPACYDVIYAFDVLEHIAKEKQLELLKAFHANLSDDGFIVLQTPNALSPTMGLYRYDDFTHTVIFTEKSLAFLLHNAGFHYFTFRAEKKESRKLKKIKYSHAKLYYYQFGIENPILTPNIVAVACKTQQKLDNYLSKAPIIDNNYLQPEKLLARIWRHLKAGKF